MEEVPDSDIPADQSIVASNARLVNYLENILREVEAGRFPLRVSSRRCERFNQFPTGLNARNEVEDIEGIQKLVREIEVLVMLMTD